MEFTMSMATGLLLSIGSLVGLVVWIAAAWRVYAKAGAPGWTCLIPFYNLVVLLEIAHRPGWWLFLLFLPYVGIIFYVIVLVDVARWFGKGIGFGLGLAFLSPVFFPILGFGSAVYEGGPYEE